MFITDLISKITNFRVKVGDKLNTLKSQIGQLNLLTTNDKTSLVGAVNEVNNKQVNLVPYTGANKDVNLNTKRLLTNSTISTINGNNVINLVSKTVASNHSTNSIVFEIKSSGSSRLMGTYAFEMFRYASMSYKFNITSYIYNNNWHHPVVTWVSGNSSDISSIKLIKKSDSEFYIEIIFNSNISYMTAKVDWLGNQDALSHEFNLYRGSEVDLSTSTISNTIIPPQFTRDPYLLDFNNFTNVPDFAKSADVFKKDEATNWTNANQRWSNLPNKSADATYDKVMVLDSSGKAGTKDAGDFGKVKTVNGKSPDSSGNTDIGIDDTLRVNNITERIIEFEDGGITLDVIDEEGLVDKKFFAYSVREEGKFQIGTGCGASTGGWSAPTFFGFGSLKKLNRNNTTNESSGLTAYGFNSLTAFEGGVNGGITSIGSYTLGKFVGTNDLLPAKSYFLTALGVNTLREFLNGSRNTALGGSSGRNLVTGSNNTFTGAASMQDLGEGSNNTAIGYQVAATLKKGSNNTFIGANLKLNEEEVNATVIIADGTGKQHFKSDDKGSILPSQTIALIDADETGKAITTKEYLDSKLDKLVLTSPGGNKFELSVDDNGNLITTKIN